MMKTFWIRTATALLFAALMVVGIFWNQYSFFLLMSVILMGSLYEYFIIIHSEEKDKRSTRLVLFIFWFFYAASFFLPQIPVAVLIGVLAFKLLARPLFFKSEQPFSKTQHDLLPVLWISLPIMLTNQIFFEKGPYFLFAIFSLIWIYDSGCYIVGSLVGKNKLMEHVSPKKTIEGAQGGIVITFIIAYFFNRIPQLAELSSLEWLLIALVVVICATIGDLVESAFKRSYQVKDSGSIMPGHGGFLDRFDAYFFTVPFVMLALWLFDFVRRSDFF
ncbi:MAG: phosphatidate cytidylyltransferase [Bacteroidetes bacterium]|nr:phosphatidate cytidylyltransferase [Bacteroidota bacterium]